MNGASTARGPPLVATPLQDAARGAAEVASNNLMNMMDQNNQAVKIRLLEKSLSDCLEKIDFREQVASYLEDRLESLEKRLDIVATGHIVPRSERSENALAALPSAQLKAQANMLEARLGNPREDQGVSELRILPEDVEDVPHETLGAEGIRYEKVRQDVGALEKYLDKICEDLMDKRERHEKAVRSAESQWDQAKVEREGLRADVDVVKQSLMRLEQRLDEMEHGSPRAQVSSIDQRLKDHSDKEIQPRIAALERGLESVRESCPGRDSTKNLSSEVTSIKDGIAELSGGLGSLPVDHDILDQAMAEKLEKMRQEHSSGMAKVREESALQMLVARLVVLQNMMALDIAALRKMISADIGKQNRQACGAVDAILMMLQTGVGQHYTQPQQPEQTTEEDDTPMRDCPTEDLQSHETPTGSSISSQSAENSSQPPAGLESSDGPGLAKGAGIPVPPSSPTIHVRPVEEPKRDVWEVSPTPEPKLCVLPAMNPRHHVRGMTTRPPGAATYGGIASDRKQQFKGPARSSMARHRDKGDQRFIWAFLNTVPDRPWKELIEELLHQAHLYLVARNGSGSSRSGHSQNISISARLKWSQVEAVLKSVIQVLDHLK